MMRTTIAALCVAGTLDAHVALAQEKPTVALARIVSSIPQGSPWGNFQEKFYGWNGTGGCFLPPDRAKTLAWNGNSGEVSTQAYLRPFAEALRVIDLASAEDPDNLLQKERGVSDLALAADIKHLDASLCVGMGSTTHRGAEGDLHSRPFWNLLAATGKITITVQWQLYSKSQDKVIYRHEVISDFEINNHQDGNLDRLIEGVMKENIVNLVRAPDFKPTILTASAPQNLAQSTQPKILLVGTQKEAKISDAVGSVVLIFSGGGHGSGFLVSSDGYIMTAEHVVGSDKYVKIRWSDGLEGVGEVVRSDKRRDVALIKADPRGRSPLALRRSLPQPGDTVFAIGAPIDPKLQSTVTRGVASANRIMDGFSFIQSDVTVDPGNSGGPLLDEKGQVLGFTDLGFRTPDAPTGLNFFVPIDDALRFLSAEPR